MTATRRNPITDNLVIVKLSVGRFGERMACSQVETEIAEAHDADKGSIDAMIRVLQRTDVARLNSIRSQARTDWKRHTLVWEDGQRVCPVKKYAKLKGILDAHRRAFLDAVQTDIITRWDEILKNGQERLKDLFNPEALPSKEQVGSSYHFTVELDRVPEPRGFHFNGLSGEDTQEIEHQAQDRLRERLVAAQKELTERLINQVSKAVEKFTDKKPKYVDVMLENIRELVAELPDMNILDDPEVTALIDKVREKLASLDADTLEKSKKVRETAKQDAIDILDDLKAYKPKQVTL